MTANPTRYIASFKSVLMLAMVLAVFMPTAPAHAVTNLCPTLTSNTTGLIGPVVTCVKTQLESQISTLSNTISSYMRPIVAELFALAVIFFGIRVMGGAARWGEVLGFMTRLAVVGAFWSSMGFFANNLMRMPEEFIAFTPVGGDPWSTLDQHLGRMVGYGANLTIASGLIGILAGAMFSSAFGFTLFLFGVKAMLDMVFFIIQAVFVYLTAIMVLAFMLAISPLMIPLAIFAYTEQYVRSYCSIIAAAILTPMFVFMALDLFLDQIATYINAIFNTLNASSGGTPDFAALWRSQRDGFSWLMPADPNLSNTIASGGGMQASSIPTSVDRTAKFGFNASMFDMGGLNFGLNNITVVQELLKNFAALIIVTYLIRSLVDQMPSIAAGIAGGGHGLFNMQSTGAERAVKGKLSELQGKFGGGGGK